MQIGMNVSAPIYWSPEHIFIDRMKSSGEWTKGTPVDERGWPTGLPEGKTSTSCSFPMSDVPEEYIIRWKGDAKFKLARNYAGAVQTPGKNEIRVTTARLPTGNANQFIAYGPISDVSVVPARLDEAWQRGEIFDPSYLANPLVSEPDVHRFMDWLRTNGSTRTDMGPAEDVRTYMFGVPLTVCLKLAKATGAKAWIPIPEHATDATILAMGSACPPGTIFEWSNEVWNAGFAVGKTFIARAAAEDVDRSALIGRRMGEVALLLAKVGQRLAVGYQPTVNPKGWDRWEAALKATGAKPGWIITSAYPTGGLNSLSKITPYMAADDVAGVQQALATDVLECRKRFDNAAAIAARFGCGWMVYEGNVAHLNTSNGYDTAVEFVAKVQRDQGMKPIGEALLNHALDAGCETFCAFDLSSQPTKHGYFGVLGTPFGEVLLARMLVEEPLTLESLDRRVRALEGR